MFHVNFAAIQAVTVWESENRLLASEDAVLICTGSELQLVSLSAWQQTGQLVVLQHLPHQKSTKTKCPNHLLDHQSFALQYHNLIVGLYSIQQQPINYTYQIAPRLFVFNAFFARAPPYITA